MRMLYALISSLALFVVPAIAQNRVVDVMSQSPVAAASIFDVAGNMIGITGNEGELPDLQESAYPITLCCLGYEQLVIGSKVEKNWEMIPIAYELDEVVITPVKQQILKQTFYIREYFNLCSVSDTLTVFKEHMANRFVPVSKDAKFGGSSSLRILATHNYSHYKSLEEDSIAVDSQSVFPSLLGVLHLSEGEVRAPESFKESDNKVKVHKEMNKSGISLVQKQNSLTFTTIKGMLGDSNVQIKTPWILKAIGFAMDFKQLYIINTYRVNDEGVYLPTDLMEASFVMEAVGKGKFIRKTLNSSEPVIMRSMIELYIVDIDCLSPEEAKEQYRNKPSSVEFVVPSNVPPMNEAVSRYSR